MRDDYQGTFLPHILPLGSTYFVTFNLFDAIPNAIMVALKRDHEQRKQAIVLSDKLYKQALLYRETRYYFKLYDEALDKLYNGIKHLENKDLAELVKAKIFEFNGIWYNVLAVSIMPNRVHVLLDFSIQLQPNIVATDDNYMQLDRVMKRIKGATGYDSI